MSDRFIAGFHAIQTRLRSRPDSIIEIMIDDSRQDARSRGLVVAADQAKVRVMKVAGSRLDSIAGRVRHQGVVARISSAEAGHSLDGLLDDIAGPILLLLLDGITDPHNLGACLRVADASGVHAVIAPKDRAVGIGATVSKVACGAAELVPYFMVTNLSRTISELKEREIWVIGTDDSAPESVFDANLTGSVAWVLGAEGAGMRRLTRERCDQLVRIPMSGGVSSLNVSVASGVCLFETVRQRTLKQA
jgi:23S rRNA (guanosine2251-2'-O)-methyltransferase